MEPAVTIAVEVTGQVQGVGYRWSLAQVAEMQGILGWVRNRSDGAVEARLRGSQASIDRVVDWMRHGPPGAVVTEVQTRVVDDQQPFARFEIRM